MRSPYGMRFRSLANFVGPDVSGSSARYPLTERATKGRAIEIKLITLPGSDAEQAAISNRNGITYFSRRSI
ncbi:MAG: hypothetical protein CVU62_09215 [Deltaproteobacteria bacterium HGW-Deltaproteobacteria-2]|jgi:hypothetical protein|nr:MAG: hypothetical protein CVU62_09215 [Deltaproteobacteria bacterium HGW-Deltaproteobacteria-2]